ncbi:kunitz-type protease inhibitor 1-like isoform X2 [Channa argus]|uniref:kunitz-type protease inhibitor 1-like isoform X2 n=1 Tax=Channa argus TaxID=215402 RepID=UPI0035225645
MPPSSSSSSSSLRLLLIILIRAAGCDESFRTGQRDFALDTNKSVREGATLLATAYVNSETECQHVCCADPLCNLALLEPPGGEVENRTCDLFNCIYRNRFVCSFVNQAGYLSYIREPVFQKYLAGPQSTDKPAPPIANAGSDIVVQPGETVMLNGIESMALGDAKIVDYSWNLESGNEDISMEETDLPDQRHLSNLSTGSYLFKLTVTDSNGQTDDAMVKVLVLNPEQSSLYCLTQMKIGPCRAAFPRWFYDAKTSTCQQFVFGGCTPNKNNYLSNEECMAACRGVTATSERSGILHSDICNPKCQPDQLTCNATCCLDDSLECDGVKHCSDGTDEINCNKLNHTFSRLLSIDVNERKAQCTQVPHTGPCRASHTRWYYDPVRKRCYRFTYGGCEANENNFEKEDKCKEACDGVTELNVFSRGMFERYESEEEDKDGENSGQVALAVILTVTILALLAIVTYCFLKTRRERSHQPVPTSPAHVAMSEQETLVYNSTTKPV